MSLTLEKLKKAREAGYSDDEIISTASQKYPKIGNAIKSGYSIDEIADFYTTSPRAQAAAEQETISKLKEVPQAINRGEGLPVGGEPMVGGPDILALEPGQTKTFMEDEEGKPVEVRRAEAIGVTGKVIPEPISPDGMSLDSRGSLIKEKAKELQSTSSLPFSEYMSKSSAVRDELKKLQEAQQKHEANQMNFLSNLVTQKGGVEVEMEAGLGEERVTGPEGKITKVPIKTRQEAAFKAVADFRQQIDDIIVNDNFLEYAATKGITTPGFLQAKLGRIGIGSEAYNQELDKLKQNQDVRKLAEEWAMTTPGFAENVSDIFGRAWDGYAGAIGSGTVGPIGLALQEIGFENAGQSLVEAADFADQMRQRGQDPRKVSELAQFGRDVSSGLGFTASAIATGLLGNTARASLGLNAPRTIDLFQKANTLSFSGLNSAWGGYSEARANGATDEQAKQAALFTGLTQAPLELVSPLQKWIGRFDPAQQSRIYKGLNKAAQAVIEGTEEALFNEMPQQIAGNLVKKYVYEPNQDIFEGTVYAGGVGGAAGVMASIFTQMLGVKKTNQKQKQGDDLGAELDDIDSEADKAMQELAPDPESALAAQMMEKSTEIDNLKEEIDNDEMGLQAFETGTPERQQADMALKVKKDNLAQLEGQFAKLSAAPAPEVTEAAPAEAAPETKEQINTRIEELNKEFDALDENDTAGQDRVNKAIFAEQNKLAEMTAIEQGVEPQATTPTREMGLPPSGRRSPFGTFYPDRPVLQAFVKATDKAIKGIRVAGKRAQKLKNAIRTNIARNAGFLAGINAEVISSEDYGNLTGKKQVVADSGTYRAAFFNGKKYLVLPDVNQLTATTIKGEQRAASKDAALDQESRAADKKLEEEMIHLSMYQALQDEFAALKKPKQTEQQYIVSRIGQIAQEVKRTNPNAVPGVSEAYLGPEMGTLDDVGFSMEFMRMVIQRVRTGQITEDLNAIRTAEREAFSDADKGAIASLKNSILNALKFVRNSLARYLGKGTSTREVKRMEDSINNILDEYGIVKGEANYEFKDYSAAQPKGEVSLTITPTKESAPAEPTAPAEGEIVAKAATPQQVQAATRSTESKNALELIRGNYGELSDIINKIIDTNPKIADALQKIAVEKTDRNSFDGETVRINSSYTGPKLVDTINHEIAHAFLAVALREVPSFREAINAIRNDAIERAKYSNDASFRYAVALIREARGLSNGPIYPLRKGENLSQYMSRNSDNLLYLWKIGGRNPIMTYEIFESAYALASNDEFLSHLLSDKRFRDELNKYKVFTPDNRNLFQKFIDAVRGLFKKLTKVEKSVLDKAMEQVEYVVQLPEYNPRPIEGLGDLLAKTDRGIVARAGVTPRVVSEQRRITNDMLEELNDMIATLQPKRSRAGKEYVSRTTQKGKTYPSSLVSPYSRAANLYTSNTYEEATKALNKLFTKNPDADFFSVVSDVANQADRYGLTESERNAITPILYRLIPAYREEIMESRAAIKDREAIALKSLDLESNLAKLIVDQQQASARTLNAAKQVRNIGGAGTAVAAYKSKIIDGLADLYTIIRGDFTQLAEVVRGDRRKAVDNVFTLKEVLSRISQLKTKAEKNPQAAVNAIRKAVAKKKTRKAREIVLEFCASMFDTKGDKYANMVVDETAKAIMSIGADRKDFSPDNVYKYIYQAFGAVAKQTAKEEAKKAAKEAAAKEGEPKVKEAKKREGKYLAQVKSVIGNDKAYKQFIAELKTKIGSLYQDNAEFQDKYKELFSMLEDRQWSEAMRNQAIKDSADFLDYKFNDLITYIGENRSAAQSAVKAHIRAELSNIGATNEQIDKFVDDVQTYLDNETAKRVKKSLGFEISKETGRIIGGKIEKEAMKKVATAEERFQLAKTLKGLTKLAATDQRAFLDKLNELIITELGFDDATSNELSKYIEEQMAKAIQAQKSENLQSAIDRAQETLTNNGIKKKANQRTVIQRLIEMANMGQLDEFGVYEAFRQTHDFGKGYLEWNPELANQLRDWGDRISALPEGVTRSIEEQKLGRFMLENQVFSARDYFSSYWYFALLSQAGTQVVNFLGSTFNLLGNMAVWSVYTKGKSTGPMLRALYNATIRKEAPSRNAFAYTMQTGLNPSGIQDEKMMKYPKTNLIEGANPNNTPKWVYNIITFGDGKIDSSPAWLNAILATISPRGLMRTMRATDSFMREVAYEVRAASFGAAPFQQDQYNQAKEQAIRELASSKSKGKEKNREIIIRANEIYSQQRLDEDNRLKAEQDALETIYSQTPVGVVGSIASLANKLLQVSPITQLFIPFSNVVANVLNENLNYLPTVGIARLAANVKLSPLLRGKIELKPSALKSPFIMGREEKAADIAIKSAIGFAGMAVPVIIAALTGGDDEDQKERPPVQFYATGPADPEQNKIWKENGGVPYSIRVGDKYVSYLYTPLVIPLATGSMLAEFYDRFEKKKEKTPLDAVEVAITVAVAPFAIGFVAALDQSFLTGVADLIELKEAQDIPAAGKNIATNIISRLAVPGVMRDMQKMLTDEKLEGDVYVTNLLKEFPGSSAFLDKKLGYFGDPARYNSIMQENGPGRRALSLVARIASSETPDPAFEIMYRNALTPPKWQGSLKWSNDIKMNKAEQREFVGIAGPLMKEWIIDNEETLNDLPNDEAQEFLSNNIGQIRRSVKADLEFEKGIEVDLE